MFTAWYELNLYKLLQVILVFEGLNMFCIQTFLRTEDFCRQILYMDKYGDFVERKGSWNVPTSNCPLTRKLDVQNIRNYREGHCCAAQLVCRVVLLSTTNPDIFHHSLVTSVMFCLVQPLNILL